MKSGLDAMPLFLLDDLLSLRKLQTLILKAFAKTPFGKLKTKYTF